MAHNPFTHALYHVSNSRGESDYIDGYQGRQAAIEAAKAMRFRIEIGTLIVKSLVGDEVVFAIRCGRPTGIEIFDDPDSGEFCFKAWDDGLFVFVESDGQFSIETGDPDLPIGSPCGGRALVSRDTVRKFRTWLSQALVRTPEKGWSENF